jgi:Tol biopolymer transport system component
VNSRRTLLVAIAFGLASPGIAQAQYFGRNKVQYETFKFEVLHTQHFNVFFYPEERAAAADAGRMAERWYARLSTYFHHDLHGQQPLIVYASHPHFEQTNAIEGELDEGTGGVTEALKRRIVVPFAGPLGETDHVIGHELVHAFQYDITGEGRASAIPGATRMPLWFIEGMAEYLSIGPVDPNTTMWMRDAVQHNKIPSIRQLDDPRYFPYRWGQAFWAYLTGRYGDQVVGDLLRDGSKSRDVGIALQKMTGESIDSLSHQWQAAIREAYTPMQQATARPEAFGRPMESGHQQAQLNVAPALSPDGSRIAYFSERGLFSIQLYLADTKSGRVERTLIRTALDPHYESVGFISSSGAFDSTGKRFAFGAITHGRPVLSIIDVANDKVVREIPFPGLGQILSPTWSPDGKRIAFSALVGGYCDLFVYDLDSSKTERLTDDPYADLQPAWSPDGRSLAFVTDRFTTNLDALDAGQLRLALYVFGAGSIRPLPSFPGAKHINPQWSPDGGNLYFVSDRGGIDNVYRLDLATGENSQITNLFIGASGITPSSPVLTVAQHTGQLVFTAYDSTGFKLYSVDSAATLAGKPLSPEPEHAAALPPFTRPQGQIAMGLADATTGLPPAVPPTVSPYRSKLSLDYISQPSLAFGADRYGVFIAGGATLLWSDMLGDHNLITGFQFQGTFRDLGLIGAYQNTRRRLNWGVALQQQPYILAGYNAGYANAGGQIVYITQLQLLRQMNRSLMGFTSYPLSRVQRIEFAAGVNRISFDRELKTRIFDAGTGALLVDSTEHLPSHNPLNLAAGTAALVYDNSYFGATSPILGQVYRLEASPTFGSLNMLTLLGDYRRYIMPIHKVTLAGRVFHIGRYGKNAVDSVLTPLFLGYPGLVRGYTYGSFNSNECPTDPAAGCPAFDRLLGSRILVGNAEIRFPLLGVLGVGTSYYGGLPIEAGFFADAGVAWNPADQPSLFTVHRLAATSVGAVLRMNLFGFAIGELDFVHPFARPTKNWIWQFSLTPGF